MKRLMKKKVKIFEKEISVFLIVLVGMIGLASAALIPYFASITGLVTATQGLTWNNSDWDDTLHFDFNELTTTSLDEETFTSAHYLKNDADVDAEFTLDTICAGTEGNSCDEGTEDGINWWYEYMLEATGAQGTENRVTIVPNSSFDELSELETMSWDSYIVNGGYIAHVDVLIDVYGNGSLYDALVFEYDKVDDGCGDGIPGAANYAKDEWVDTFDDKETIDSDSYAWLNSGAPGNCQDDSGYTVKRLSEWKTFYQNAKILRFEIEVDNWILNSNGVVRNIKINGNQYEVSGLKAGDQLNFDFKVHFPKMIMPDVYNITTQVLPA